MPSERIFKPVADWPVVPKRIDHAAACDSFKWDQVRAESPGTDAALMNLAQLAVDRHAAGPATARTALRLLPRDGAAHDLSYAGLARRCNRFANVLRTLGVGCGDRVFVLAGRVPALYARVLGALKKGSVVATLFSAFGPEPVATRLRMSEGKVLVTTAALCQRKVAALRSTLPALQHVLVIDAADGASPPPCTLDLAPLMAEAGDVFDAAPTGPEDPALLHFTSGTTGTPKGALHVHEAGLTHYATGRHALDLQADDVFWRTADSGWVTGMSYGILAPLMHGVTSIVDEGGFDARRWYPVLQDERVSAWYAAPTAVRMQMKAGPELRRRFDFPRLRFVASVDEPLNPEAVWWGQEAPGLPIHDNWWQTETGGIMIANLPAMDIKPGSMGRALPGVQALVVCHRQGQPAEPIAAPGVVGELALRGRWPSLFRADLGPDWRYRKCFDGDLYLTGDLARVDADGYFWFVARSDEVIKSARHLIGPFEVESALLEHSAVAEAGVISKPDEEAVAAGALRAWRPEDKMLATYREHGHTRLRGVAMHAVAAAMYGKAEGCSRGRGGSMHLLG
ncbi:MAG: acetate--CoA ligase [Leptothrix sp. (in: Bacteria)]|nr:acetate--CoA ligase [Leptothrix sp. (in: b-proteobacteria)]